MWQMYSAKSSGYTTRSCNEGSIGIPPDDLEGLEGKEELQDYLGPHSTGIFS